MNRACMACTCAGAMLRPLCLQVHMQNGSWCLEVGEIALDSDDQEAAVAGVKWLQSTYVHQDPCSDAKLMRPAVQIQARALAAKDGQHFDSIASACAASRGTSAYILTLGPWATTLRRIHCGQGLHCNAFRSFCAAFPSRPEVQQRQWQWRQWSSPQGASLSSVRQVHLSVQRDVENWRTYARCGSGRWQQSSGKVHAGQRCIAMLVAACRL